MIFFKDTNGKLRAVTSGDAMNDIELVQDQKELHLSMSVDSKKPFLALVPSEKKSA